MSEPPTLQISLDPVRDVVTIEGQRYQGEIFRLLGRLEPGSSVLLEVCDGGAVSATYRRLIFPLPRT